MNVASWARGRTKPVRHCHPERREGPGREGLRAAHAPRSLATLGMTLVLLALSCRREPAPPPQAPAPPPKPVVTNTSPVPKPLEAKQPKAPESPPIDRDLPAIAAAKTLKILFTFNSTGYFVYRGETMGYEYDLLNQ